MYTVERRRDQLEFLDHLFCVPALPQSQAFNGSQEGRRDVGGDASNGGLGSLARGPVRPLSGALRMQCFDSRPFPGHPRHVHRHPVLQLFGPSGRFLLVLLKFSAALLQFGLSVTKLLVSPPEALDQRVRAFGCPPPGLRRVAARPGACQQLRRGLRISFQFADGSAVRHPHRAKFMLVVDLASVVRTLALVILGAAFFTCTSLARPPTPSLPRLRPVAVLVTQFVNFDGVVVVRVGIIVVQCMFFLFSQLRPCAARGHWGPAGEERPARARCRGTGQL